MSAEWNINTEEVLKEWVDSFGVGRDLNLDFLDEFRGEDEMSELTLEFSVAKEQADEETLKPVYPLRPRNPNVDYDEDGSSVEIISLPPKKKLKRSSYKLADFIKPRSVLPIIDVEALKAHWVFVVDVKKHKLFVHFFEPETGDITGEFTRGRHLVVVDRKQYAIPDVSFVLNNNYDENPSVSLPQDAKDWFMMYGHRMRSVQRLTIGHNDCFYSLKTATLSKNQMDGLYNHGRCVFSGL